MHFSAPVTLMLATMASASAIPGTPKRQPIPDLPNGFFEGINHPNGSTTLTFEKRGSFTFEPFAMEPESNQLDKRVPYGKIDCWRFQPELNHAGVDKGVQALRDRLNINAGFWIGLNAGSKYFGHNNDGVYVYFCHNNNKNERTLVTREALDFATYWTDHDCGAYRPGYYQWDTPLLFGKTLSGTSVCLGQ